MLYFGNVYKFCSRLIFPAENSLAFFFGAAGGISQKQIALVAQLVERSHGKAEVCGSSPHGGWAKD